MENTRNLVLYLDISFFLIYLQLHLWSWVAENIYKKESPKTQQKKVRNKKLKKKPVGDKISSTFYHGIVVFICTVCGCHCVSFLGLVNWKWCHRRPQSLQSHQQLHQHRQQRLQQISDQHSYFQWMEQILCQIHPVHQVIIML